MQILLENPFNMDLCIAAPWMEHKCDHYWTSKISKLNITCFWE